MTLHGQSIIAGVPTPELGDSFHPTNPATGEILQPPIQEALGSLADAAMEAADRDFDEFRAKSPEQRAKFLEAIATGLEALGEPLPLGSQLFAIRLPAECTGGAVRKVRAWRGGHPLS